MKVTAPGNRREMSETLQHKDPELCELLFLHSHSLKYFSCTVRLYSGTVVLVLATKFTKV